MGEQYGEFSKNIVALDTAQEQVRSVWLDETAKSYDSLNNNVKKCVQRIWALFSDSKNGTDAVKRNYNSDEVEKELSHLGIQIEQI